MEINQPLLSMKEKNPVDLPTNIVQAGHIREIYHPILSTTDKTGRYTNYFCLRQTKPVDIPTNFCPRQKKLGEIPTIIVHNGQNRVIYQPVLFMAHKPGIYNNQYCSQQTKQWDLPTNIVHNRLIRLIYQPILSTTGKTWIYTNHYCP